MAPAPPPTLVVAIDVGADGVRYAWSEASALEAAAEPGLARHHGGGVRRDIAAVLFDGARPVVSGALAVAPRRAGAVPLHGVSELVDSGPDALAALLTTVRDAVGREIATHGLEDRPSRWCLTVPALWSGARRRLLRRAAVRAGMPDDDVVTVVDHEAAAAFCAVRAVAVRDGRGRASMSVAAATATVGGAPAPFLLADCGASGTRVGRYRVRRDPTGDPWMEIEQPPTSWTPDGPASAGRATFGASRVDGARPALLVLTGGHAHATSVQEALRRWVDGRTPVVVLDRAADAVVLGALHLGADPMLLRTRRLQHALGVAVSEPFVEGTDSDHRRVLDDDGRAWCRDRFRALAGRDAVVELGGSRYLPVYPGRSDQTGLRVDVHATRDAAPTDVGEAGPTRIASLDVDLRRSAGRPVETRGVGVEIVFGSAGVEVRATDLATGETQRVQVPLGQPAR